MNFTCGWLDMLTAVPCKRLPYVKWLSDWTIVYRWYDFGGQTKCLSSKFLNSAINRMAQLMIFASLQRKCLRLVVGVDNILESKLVGKNMFSSA